MFLAEWKENDDFSPFIAVFEQICLNAAQNYDFKVKFQHNGKFRLFAYKTMLDYDLAL